MARTIKDTYDFVTEGRIINLPDAVNDGDAVNFKQLKATNYTRRHAFNSANSYMGVAPQGSSESANVWSITRITVAVNGTTTTAQAVNVNWTNYLTHTYS